MTLLTRPIKGRPEQGLNDSPGRKAPVMADTRCG